MPFCNTSLVDIGDEQVSKELPVWGNLTFHQLGLFLSAGFAALASATAIILILGHAMHYSQPYQQKHIIRVLAMIPIYSIISFVSYWQYRHAIYWEVLRDCYEAFAIASFFTLLCHYVEPTLHDQKEYFRRIEVKNWIWPLRWLQNCTGGQSAGLFRKPRSGLTWFNIIWVAVFQYCAIRVTFTFVAMFSQFIKRYCESSLSPAFAHIWVLVFEGGAVTVAMYCLIQFYVQLKEDLAEYKPLLKILCIKLVIFFSFWQNFLISLLTSGSHSVLKTSPHIAYPDLKVGIPSMLLTIEMSIFAVLHHFAFPWKPYDVRNSPDPNARYQGGTFGWRAFADAFNPWDIIKASARGFRWLLVRRRLRETDISYKEPGLNNAIALERSRTGPGAGAGAGVAGALSAETAYVPPRYASPPRYGDAPSPMASTTRLGAVAASDFKAYDADRDVLAGRPDRDAILANVDDEDQRGLLRHAQSMPRS